MSNQLRFPVPPPPSPSQRAARRRPSSPLQLDLFADDPRKVVSLPIGERPFDLAFSLDLEGDERALELYEQAAQRGDRPADAYCNIGVWHSRAGEAEPAVRSFCQALARDPAHLLSHFNLGNLYLGLEHTDLARAHYQRCLEIDPAFAGAFINLAWIHAVNGERRQGLDALERFAALVTPEEARAALPLRDWLYGGGTLGMHDLLSASEQAEVHRMVGCLQEMCSRYPALPHDHLRPGRTRLLQAAISSLSRLVEE